MLRDVADKLAVKVKMAETKIFPIANQQERLIVTRVDGQPMTAIALSVLRALACKARLIIAVLIEFENARISVAVRNIQ